MKKILAVLLAAVLILGLLSACGSEPAQEPETKSGTAAEAQPAQEGEAKPEETAKPEGEAKSGEAKTESKDAPAATEQKIPDGVAFYAETTVVTADAGSVTVPVKLSGNTGLAGAFVEVKYDPALKLTDVKAGDALKSLNLTPGGDYASNPFNLLWDGQDADATSGTVALLTFSVPKEAGQYSITLSGEKGNFYGNDLKDVSVSFVEGFVVVGK